MHRTAQYLAKKLAQLETREASTSEYSIGTLTATALQPKSVTLVLRDHPYGEHALMRTIIAEAFRYVLSLTRTKQVSSIHLMSQGDLRVVLVGDSALTAKAACTVAGCAARQHR
jgi:hypothetical protein